MARFLGLLIALALVEGALAQGSPAQFGVSFEWVTVGDPGNPNDPLIGPAIGTVVPRPERGSVPYVYNISKYETTIGQYTAFLNAVAKSDPHGLYSPELGQQDIVRGIGRARTDGNYVYYVKNLSGVLGGGISSYLPVTYIGFFDAARFVNWLHNGQGNSSTETGAYTISEGQIVRTSRSSGVVTATTAQPHTLSVGDRVYVGADNDSDTRINGTFSVTATTSTTFQYANAGNDFAEQQRTGSFQGINATHKPDARYWIPTENEWYKAAYYDPSPAGPVDHYWWYPWRSDDTEPGRRANYFNGTFAVTSRPNPSPSDTYITDVRGGNGNASYYGTLNQAGNVEEWTEGDAASGGPESRGGHWNGPITEMERMKSFSGYPLPTYSGAPETGFRLATVANPPPGGLRNGDKIRFYPRPGFASRMVGGVFESGDGSLIYTITKVPPDGWSEVNVDFGTATVLRYRSPDGGYGNVAEIEFYRSGAKVIAAADGTPGSWSGKDKDTFKAAFDGNTSTFFDALQSNGAFVQVDTGFGTDYALSEGFDQLMLVRYLNFPSTTESHRAGERVYVFSYTPPPTGYYFAGWEGFIDILDDPSATSTMATMPGTGTKMWLAATYKPVPPGSSILTVYRGSGSGVYPAGTMVAVSADPPSTGQQFAGWTGDIAILSNPFITTTTAIAPSMDTSIFANYDASGLSDKIRFFPRAGYAERMIGGVFEGTNGDSIGGPYKTIYIIASKPSEGWSEVNARLDQINLSEYTPYRYLRYRAPNGSYGNVAEIEFYRQGQKLTDAGYGTAGSWNGLGASFDKALDGNTSTFFNAPTSDGAYVGVDTNSDGTLLGDAIKYYPRAGRAERMVGGVFEGTTGDPVSGPYTTIYTITSVPPLEWNVVRVDLGNYRYLRYRGPDGSYGNVAEVGFYRNGAKLTGQGFGTSGSWSGSGSTFDKALDGDVNTFFDAPSANGVYVGIGMY